MLRGRRDSVAFTVVVGILVLLGGIAMALVVALSGAPSSLALAALLAAVPVGPLVAGLLLGGTFVMVTAYGLQLGRALAPRSQRRIFAFMTAAFGVGLPGHYIVKVQFELNEVYVDPFHDGTTLTMTEIGALLRQVSGGQVHLGSEHLRAWSGRETLARVLANLQSMWTRAGDTRRAASARERMEILTP